MFDLLINGRKTNYPVFFVNFYEISVIYYHKSFRWGAKHSSITNKAVKLHH